MIEKQHELSLHYSKLRLRCVIRSHQKNHLTLTQVRTTQKSTLHYRFSAGVKVALYFKFRESPISCSTYIAKEQEQLAQSSWDIIIEKPTAFYRDLSRSLERVIRPSGIYVRINLANQNIKINLPLPRAASYANLGHDTPKYISSINPDFDIKDIHKLSSSFRTTIKSYGFEGKIVMFREHHKPSMIERIMIHSGNIVALPVDRFKYTKVPPSQSPNVLTEQMIKDVANDLQIGNIDRHLQIYTNELTNQQISSVVLCPVQCRQYTVGYLYICKNDNSAALFPAKVLEYCAQFAKALSYSLDANGYIDKLSKIDIAEHGPNMIDISGSGMLFCLPKKISQLDTNIDLPITLTLETHKIYAQCKIVHTFSDSENRYYGVQFTQLTTEEISMLFDKLYGKQYRGDIDQFGTTESPEMLSNQSITQN